MKQAVLYISAVFLAIFGFLTLFLSGSVIFDLFGTRAKEGNYVLMVVLANFLSSFLYLFGAYGFLRGKKWTALLLSISGVVLLSAFAGLMIHVNSGGLYETKTIGAMIFRITVTAVFAMLAYFLILKKQKNEFY